MSHLCDNWVQNGSLRGVSRETFAVFMEPEWSEPMDIPSEKTAADAQNVMAAANLPKGVPPLGSRWEEGQDFSDFTAKTLQAYH